MIAKVTVRSQFVLVAFIRTAVPTEHEAYGALSDFRGSERALRHDLGASSAIQR